MTTDGNMTPQHKRPSSSHIHNHQANNQTMVLRQWLNIIFMVGAIIGVAIYFFGTQTWGTYIILGAMVFKIIECALRMFK